MTRYHSHATLNSEFGKLRAGNGQNLSLPQRDFLQTGVVLLSGAVLPRFLADLSANGSMQEFTEKRIYIAPDGHTDLFWTADLPTYEKVFTDMPDKNFKVRYPYQVIGVFGYGWDDLQTQTDRFVEVAKNLSDQNFKVIVSNEMDFAQDFEKTHADDIPSLSVSFGNEWDLDCASMAEVSAGYKRAVEKLRTAESLATLASSRDLAWMNMGLFWEHNWQGALWENLVEKSIAGLSI